MTRIETTFARLRTVGRKALVPFITAGERIVVDTNEVTYLRRAD